MPALVIWFNYKLFKRLIKDSNVNNDNGIKNWVNESKVEYFMTWVSKIWIINKYNNNLTMNQISAVDRYFLNVFEDIRIKNHYQKHRDKIASISKEKSEF